MNKLNNSTWLSGRVQFYRLHYTISFKSIYCYLGQTYSLWPNITFYGSISSMITLPCHPRQLTEHPNIGALNELNNQLKSSLLLYWNHNKLNQQQLKQNLHTKDWSVKGTLLQRSNMWFKCSMHTGHIHRGIEVKILYMQHLAPVVWSLRPSWGGARWTGPLQLLWSSRWRWSSK